ncbi:helix-turn-helix domain-containing protein [Salinarimonas rosea]|uniref:helix-turn-helix domain-containing protein n=1 Tax=Salinarimonas rosea TaxID=552063 RepID=UPI0004237F6A|nr:helix-turn-helix transcriptional regulator [Salinarimonas rosea]
MINLDALVTAPEMQAKVAAAARARRLALDLTQDALSARSGVPIATLRRFEAGEAASFATVLAVAEALDALDAFAALFPPPEPTSLDDLAPPAPRRSRAGRRRSS